MFAQQSHAPVSGMNGTRNYPRECWWVAATSDEVTSVPLSRRLLGHLVVLFRITDGRVVALEDRCAHRGAPLSRGQLVGDDIVCPYHGFRYNAAGACTCVPSQSGMSLPAALGVRSYPVREHAKFVWIWMGDPQRVDPALLVEFPWFDTPAALRWCRYYGEIKCNYMAMHENILDITHAPFVHRGPANAEWAPPRELTDLPAGKVKTTPRTVSIEYTWPDSPVDPISARQMGIEKGARVRRVLVSTFASPACNVSSMQTEQLTLGSNARVFTWRHLQCLTPSLGNRCHWWNAQYRDYGHASFAQYYDRVMDRIAKEDIDLLEALEQGLEQTASSEHVHEISVRSDRAGLEARRLLEKMLADEAQGARGWQTTTEPARCETSQVASRS
jgi:phenylpropionate dioxygenase-like ring-hydroxylating dioxygenase large terminal subunit